MQAALINKLANGSILGLLETNVSTEIMLESLDWEQSKLKDFEKLRSEKKKKEWLGVRLLLDEILNSQSFNLKYDNQGKPFLTDPFYNISISHSGNYVCAFVNQHLDVGVDIQSFRQNIKKGVGLFMSEKELEDCADKMNAKTLHIYWSAKEAIYKLIGLKETSIKNDIYIFPFEIGNSGKLKGRLANRKIINLECQILEEYTLVYTI